MATTTGTGDAIGGAVGCTRRSRVCRAALLALLLALPAFPVRGVRAQSAVTPPAADSIADALRATIARADLPGASLRDYERYRAPLGRLYDMARAAPIWTSNGRPTPRADAAIASLAAAASHGLRARDYDAEPLRARAAARAAGAVGAAAPRASEAPARRELVGDVPRGAPVAVDQAAVARFDVWLSLSVMRFMQHLHRGRANPRSLGFALPADTVPFDLAAQTLAASRSADVESVFRAAEPPFSRYAALERALATYRALAADTTLHLPPRAARSVRPGDVYAGVPVLRRLLSALGDLAPSDTARAAAGADDVYDAPLVGAVRAFQERHALVADGTIGPATMAQLRVPLAQRVRQIELTLERWRWLPVEPGRRFAVVNIAGFRLYLFNRDVAGEAPVLALDVIVGQAYRRRRTPVFVGTMRSVVFRPYWDVPPSIARNEIIPAIRKDPAYFTREALEIVRGTGADGVRYAPTAANLARVAAGTLRIRQRPGEKNALGPVKFIFPNAYNVYLHGTPATELFAHARRDFSHGCIRVSDPAALATFVLQGQDDWDRPRIEAAMRGTRTVQVTLARPLPVYILYATAVVADDGRVFFYPDVYGHDAALARALGAP
ncbi:MAG: L,D-transpeptidase family protein [Gemmatimonadaceae bacterium]|nr:L,D-transpeptidase family protein [Gemmatimonadaceae bacterium]